MIDSCVIFDSHLHFNENFNSIEDAYDDLQNQLSNSSVDKGLVIHLEDSKWSYRQFAAVCKESKNLRWISNVNPNNDNCIDFMKKSVLEYGAIGVKIHPRINRINPDHPSVINVCNQAAKLSVPVTIDAFPADIDSIASGAYSARYAKLAQSCKETKLVYAHLGGHHALDFMFMAKAAANVYLDASLSPLYYKPKSLSEIFRYVVGNLKENKILFGSDYPSKDIRESLDFWFCDNESGLEFKVSSNLFAHTAEQLYNWK